ncbi:EamA family transporter [Sphingomonas sp.]|jgi:O-acetylserine/cysteine efflux transporter|uniref:EamA family transporter n=1 Tax=Sphingomonas sp. TaxID=28214 RepID=UPI002DE5FC1D|nr:EamA family transporter [Sphingomonas sp.]HEV2567889.1 EamA family transporter [Sphingomonas sp.]
MALAIAVVTVWGTNFVIVHEALQQFPPLTFGALRFLIASVPLLVFVRPPLMPPLSIVAYAVLVGAGQFGLLALALDGRISPGTASFLLQTQAFFTIGLAVLIVGERVTLRSVVALAVCLFGVLIVALNVGADASAAGVVLVIGSALSWAGGNVIVKSAGAVCMFSLVVWSSLIAAPVLMAGALLLEGPDQIVGRLGSVTLAGWLALLWQAIGNVLFGYGAWNILLSRYPAAMIAPLTLMVPVIGMACSSWYLKERMPAWKLTAAILIVGGLALNSLRPVAVRPN